MCGHFNAIRRAFRPYNDLIESDDLFHHVVGSTAGNDGTNSIKAMPEP